MICFVRIFEPFDPSDVYRMPPVTVSEAKGRKKQQAVQQVDRLTYYPLVLAVMLE
jgi:hypothetical protein